MLKLNTVQKPKINRFHLSLLDQGVDVLTLYDELGVSCDVMKNPEGSISMTRYLRLLELASEYSGKRFLAVDMAIASHDHGEGIIKYMLKNVSSVSQGLKLLSDYVSLISPGSKISMINAGEECLLTYKTGNYPDSSCRQDVEGTVTQLVLMMQMGINNPKWWPEKIYFQHSNDSWEEKKSFPFGESVIFDHHFNGFAFSPEYLDRKIEGVDSGLLKILERQARESDEYLKESDDLLDRVKVIISSSLGYGHISGDSIASFLGMSRSSLDRRLRELGLTLSELRNTIVVDIAKGRLVSSSISVTALSLSLGYSEPSAFSRAFKRITGFSPLQYRKIHS